MKKLIMVLIISLGLISCEKEEYSIIHTYKFESFEIKDGLRVGDMIMDKSWGEYHSEEYFIFTTQYNHDVFKLVLIGVDGEARFKSCSINNKSIDFEIWRAKVFNLYYNL